MTLRAPSPPPSRPTAPLTGMLDRLCQNWVYGGALASVLILSLARPAPEPE